MANERLPRYIERTTLADHQFMPGFTLLLPTLVDNTSTILDGWLSREKGIYVVWTESLQLTL